MNASKPTLLVTLIYDPKQEPDIYQKLIKHLARLEEEGGLGLHEGAHFWSNRKKSIFALPFPAYVLEQLELADVALVQVGINASGDAISGWVSARKKLERAMAGQPAEVEKAFVGRTLVYQAAISADGADSTATQSAKQETDDLLVALLDKLRLQEHHEQLPTEPLAASEVTGGKLWLLKTGRSGQENIYIALGAEEEQDTLNTAVLFGYRAALIRPDAIAHKAYFMARDYTLGDERDIFRQASFALMDKTVDILSQQKPSASLAQRARQDLATSQARDIALAPSGTSSRHISELDQLSDKAANLTAVTSSLRQLHSGLKIHRFNYQISLKNKTAGSNRLGTQIGHYHRNQINRILFRLNQDLTDAKATLDAANTAINSLRAKYEQQLTQIAEQQCREAEQYAKQDALAEQRTQDMLAIMTVALTMAQVVAKLPILWQLPIVISSAIITWLIVQQIRKPPK